MTIRTLAATVGTAALLTGAAGTPAFAQTTTDYPSDTSTTTTKKKGKGHGRLTTAQLTAVAKALGVTLDELKAAQAKVKTTVAGTSARETKAEQDALLAKELGKTTAEVQAAFASVAATRPARGSGDEDRRGGHGGRGECDRSGSGDTGSYPSDSGSYPSDTSGSYPSDGTAT